MPLSDLGDVVRVQQGKPVEVIAGTSEVLKKNGFAKESKLLSGNQATPVSIVLWSVVAIVTHCLVIDSGRMCIIISMHLQIYVELMV